MTHNRLGVCDKGLSARAFMSKKTAGDAANHPHAEEQRKKLLTRAFSELKQGNYKMAKSMAMFICEAYADTDAYMMLATSARMLGDQALSAKAYEIALAQRPDDLNLLLAYGELCLQAGQTEKAQALLKRCVERDPAHPAGVKARALLA